MENGTFEPEETRIVTEFLKRTDILVNIGANIGYYACLALKAENKVIAFEPLPSNVRLLLTNISANDWASQAEVFPLALGQSPGIVKIFGGGTGASLIHGWASTSESYFTLVPCSTAEIMVGERLKGQRSLIIVDIEGAELYMLKGANNLLYSDPRPTWIVEISVGEHQPAGVAINPRLLETFQIFWAAGYEARTADRERRLVTRSEIELITETRIDTVRTHNFIFSFLS